VRSLPFSKQVMVMGIIVGAPGAKTENSEKDYFLGDVA
jgi:hypothetical protein